MKSFKEIVNNFKEVEYLNGLIRLNHDRVSCYALANYLLRGFEKSVKTSPIFIEQIAECIKNINELSQEVRDLEEEPDVRCTLFGSCFLLYMEVRVMFSRNRIKTCLNCCEQINSMAMNGYTFVQAGMLISEKLKTILNNQRTALRASFKFFKSHKEFAALVNDRTTMMSGM